MRRAGWMGAYLMAKPALLPAWAQLRLVVHALHPDSPACCPPRAVDSLHIGSHRRLGPLGPAVPSPLALPLSLPTPNCAAIALISALAL